MLENEGLAFVIFFTNSGLFYAVFSYLCAAKCPCW